MSTAASAAASRRLPATTPGHPPVGVQYLITPLTSVMDMTVAVQSGLSLHHRAATASTRYDNVVVLIAVVDGARVRDATVANTRAGGVAHCVVLPMICTTIPFWHPHLVALSSDVNGGWHNTHSGGVPAHPVSHCIGALELCGRHSDPLGHGIGRNEDGGQYV